MSFSNTELPQDPKSRASSFHAGSSGSEESLNASNNTLASGNLSKDQSSLSHPDLSEIHKERAVTLPARGFRTGKTNRVYTLYSKNLFVFVICVDSIT